MMGTLRFEKWEGLGNDFVLVDAPPFALEVEQIRRLCDRHFGVGADGVLVVTHDAAPESGAPAGARLPRMVVYNADGSRPEMCGNGLRCVVGYLAGRGLAPSGEIVVATDAGEKACVVRAADRAGAFDVTVAMGAVVARGELTVTIDGTPHRFLTIDVGNPHAITFEPYAEPVIDRVGPRVATTPAGGTNVEFCRLDRVSDGLAPTRIAVTVWERGVGRTLACGTGACAVAAAACATGRALYDAPVLVALPGGELEITVASSTFALRMRGPARRIFTGAVEIA